MLLLITKQEKQEHWHAHFSGSALLRPAQHLHWSLRPTLIGCINSHMILIKKKKMHNSSLCLGWCCRAPRTASFPHGSSNKHYLMAGFLSSLPASIVIFNKDSPWLLSFLLSPKYRAGWRSCSRTLCVPIAHLVLPLRSLNVSAGSASTSLGSVFQAREV